MTSDNFGIRPMVTEFALSYQGALDFTTVDALTVKTNKPVTR